MDYTVEALRKCKEYGFKVYIDPHQDVVCIPSARIHSQLSDIRSQFSGPDSQEGLVPPTGPYQHAVSTRKPSLPPKPLLFMRSILLEKIPTLLPFPP